jgi:hypothetical protein
MKPARELSVVPTKPGPRKLITQRDLIEEAMLRQEVKIMSAMLRNKRQYIRDALESGATVEPGIRFATLKRTKVLIVR